MSPGNESPELSELSRWLVNVLVSEGISSKQSIRELGYFGLLKVPNIGKKSAKELCAWAGVELPHGQLGQLDAVDAAIKSLREVQAAHKSGAPVYVALSCALHAASLARTSIARMPETASD